MSYRIEQSDGDAKAIVIDGWEKGIAPSPYLGVGNIRNLNTTYYPGVAYVNYRRQAATATGTGWYAGTHSTNVSNNQGWVFGAYSGTTINNPLHKAVSPSGIIYILDDIGQIWKQSAVNSSTFNELEGGTERIGDGHGGLAYWNNYLVVFGDTMIEFCGDGTGDSGITSSNWNTLGNPSEVDVTSSQIIFATSFTGVIAGGATSGTLASNWTGVSGAYFVKFTNGALDTRTATFTNGSPTVTWSGGLSGDTPNPGQIYMYQFTATAGTFVGTNMFLEDVPVRFSSTVSLPTGISANTTYYLNSAPDLSGATIFTVSATINGNFIALTDAGSGTITMNLLASTSPPIINTTISGFSWGTTGIGSTTITLSTAWLQASGNYNIVDSLGNNLLAVFTYLSRTVTLLSPAIVQPSGTFSVQILNPSAVTYKTWVSKVDGNLYFANGRSVGRILSENTNITFSPGDMASYVVNYSVTQLLDPSDDVVDITDLKSTQIIAGNQDVYTWDYILPNVSSPSPVGEQIVKIINLLSNIYIFAGTKGNIYLSNGYANQILMKIPDFIAGAIDPVWHFGDVMVHRARLFFQTLAKNTSGTNILAGVFSLNVSPSDTPGASMNNSLVMEAQNSYGLTPASGAVTTGCLISNELFSTAIDSYYSAWSNGATTGGIDYNDTSLWQTSEPVIETDIIPIGTFLEKRTLGNMEFKLDRPMVTGDSISVYWRSSLTGTYTLIKTTTDTVLSDYKQSDIAQSQWLQLKVVMSCASSGSSAIPLREIRIHFN